MMMLVMLVQLLVHMLLLCRCCWLLGPASASSRQGRHPASQLLLLGCQHLFAVLPEQALAHLYVRVLTPPPARKLCCHRVITWLAGPAATHMHQGAGCESV